MDNQHDVDGIWRHVKGRYALRCSTFLPYSFAAARVELSRTMRAAESPSETVKDPASIQGAVQNCGPRYGARSDRLGPPVALFSRGLAHLKYDLDHPETFAPDPVTRRRASDLIESSANFFDDEDTREAALRPTLRGFPWESRSGKCQPPADQPSRRGFGLRGLFAYLVVKVKNEPGLGEYPFLQTLVIYSKILSQEEVLSSPSRPFHSTEVP